MMGLVTLGSSIPRFHFFWPPPCSYAGHMPARDGGRPMADVHGERALLNHCDANGLRRAARPTPCNHAYSSTAPLVSGETRPTTPRSPHWDPRLWRGALAGSHSPRREAPSACSHWEAAPLEPCARHFLRGTFLSKIDLNLA